MLTEQSLQSFKFSTTRALRGSALGIVNEMHRWEHATRGLHSPFVAMQGTARGTISRQPLKVLGTAGAEIGTEGWQF
jgi:hypothetical protein